MTLAPLIELLIFGVLLGGIYGVSAVGLTLIFGVAKVLNLAHGAFAVLAAVSAFIIVQMGGAHLFLAILVVIPGFFALGYVYEKTIIRRILVLKAERKVESLILGTLGIAFLAEALASAAIPRNFGLSYSIQPLELGNITLSALRLLLLGVVAITTIVLHITVYKTRYGKALRATIDDAETAQLMGINLGNVTSVTFGIGVALSALAGILLLLVTNMSPNMGFPITLTVLAIIVLGGMGSILGSLLASIVLGLGETLAGFFLDTAWSGSVGLTLLLVVMIARSEGLLRR